MLLRIKNPAEIEAWIGKEGASPCGDEKTSDAIQSDGLGYLSHFDSDVERQCDALTSKRAGYSGPWTLHFSQTQGRMSSSAAIPLLLLCVQ